MIRRGPLLHQKRDGVARGLRGKLGRCMQGVEIAAPPLASYFLSLLEQAVMVGWGLHAHAGEGVQRDAGTGIILEFNPNLSGYTEADASLNPYHKYTEAVRFFRVAASRSINEDKFAGARWRRSAS
jgi:hypothetical protein